MNGSDAAYVYDGQFDGFLCAAVEAIRRGELPTWIGVRPPAARLFGETVRIETDSNLAKRAARRLERLTEGRLEDLYHAFLSEEAGIEVALAQMLARVVAEGASALDDLRFGPALAVERAAGRVRAEVHRMHAFVRFEANEGATWTARIRPDGHVLPLLGAHFEARYATMRWAVVDVRRHLALVHVPAAERADGEPPTRIVPADAVEDGALAADEEGFQRMWRAYFRAVTIAERRNLRLQTRHVPRRYWPFLTEKREVT